MGSDRAPALKGDGFFSHWENDTLDKLFTCLKPADKGWRLTSASEPVVTKEEAPTAAALAKAVGQPLGQLDFELVSIIPAYQVDQRSGQKIEARGLIFRSSSESVLNLTSLQSVGTNCS